MNCSVYVFGVLGNSYSQYPDDHTRDYFISSASNVKAITQIEIRREGDLMYYQYIRKLSDKAEDNHYVGISFGFNGISFDDIPQLFTIFENAIQNMAYNGEIIEFAEDGSLTSKVDELYKVSSEFRRISKMLENDLQQYSSSCNILHSENIAIDKTEHKFFQYNDDIEMIKQAVANYSKVSIVKDDNYDSVAFTTISGKFKKLHNEKEQLLKALSDVDDQLIMLSRQKKQTTKVAVLVSVLFIIICVVIVVIIRKNSDIGYLNSRIASLENSREQIIKEKDEVNYQLSESRYRERELDSINIILEDDIVALRDTISNILYDNYVDQYVNDPYSSFFITTNNIGADPTDSRSYKYDNIYAMWLHVTSPTKLKSFHVNAENSGAVSIGLFDEYGRQLSKRHVRVYSEEFVEVYVNFVIDTPGYYYLAICDIERDNNKLACSSSNAALYSNYSSDNLQILGYTTKGNSVSEVKQNYYQYFYGIEYECVAKQ